MNNNLRVKIMIEGADDLDYAGHAYLEKNYIRRIIPPKFKFLDQMRIGERLEANIFMNVFFKDHEDIEDIIESEFTQLVVTHICYEQDFIGIYKLIALKISN